MTQTNEIEFTDLPLNEQIVQECLAMAKHAFASGLKVPEKVVKVLEIIMPGKFGEGEGKEEQAKSMPTMKELNTIHACLSHIIEPAKPRTILLLDTEGQKKGFLKFMAPVPFIRRMVLASIISLVLFIFISSLPEIRYPNSSPLWIKKWAGILFRGGISMRNDSAFFSKSAGVSITPFMELFGRP